MIKKITCIECPESCSLSVDIENCRLVHVSGNKCPKGGEYAKAEVENPVRVLTGTILAHGLSLKMVPVKTSKPIPKAKVLEAAVYLKSVKIMHPVSVGDIIKKDFLEDGIDLIATRDVS